MICSMTRTSWMSGRLRSTTGSSVSRHAARIGSAAFLFPPGDAAFEAPAAFDDESFHHRGADCIREPCYHDRQ